MLEQTSFFEIFEELEDPRDNREKIYPLMDIIMLAFYGVLVLVTLQIGATTLKKRTGMDDRVWIVSRRTFS